MPSLIRSLSLATFLTLPGALWAQDAGTDQSAVAQEIDYASIDVDSVEFAERPATEQMQVAFGRLNLNIEALREVAPGLVTEGRYEYSGDEESLEDLQERLRAITDDMGLGGSVYSIVNRSIQSMQDNIDRIHVLDVTEERREELLERNSIVLEQMLEQREVLQQTRQSLLEFLDTTMPNMVAEYEVVTTIDQGATVVREISEFNSNISLIRQALEQQIIPGSVSN